jgi:hypothetical protein
MIIGPQLGTSYESYGWRSYSNANLAVMIGPISQKCKKSLITRMRSYGFEPWFCWHVTMSYSSFQSCQILVYQSKSCNSQHMHKCNL